ncbi:unnamed protein product [Diplocarpon coronariae]
MHRIRRWRCTAPRSSMTCASLCAVSIFCRSYSQWRGAVARAGLRHDCCCCCCCCGP